MPAWRIHATNVQDDARRVSREHRDVVTSKPSRVARSEERGSEQRLINIVNQNLLKTGIYSVLVVFLQL